MPFSFLKYIQPTHYFRLPRKTGSWIFPIAGSLPKEIFRALEKDSGYQSPKAMEYDFSWQAIKKGYIGDTPTYKHIEKLPVGDEYRFLRKNFHPIWSLYVLWVRLFSFKNPFREIKGWWKHRKVKRVAYHKHPFQYSAWEESNGPLIQENPLVSVIIPTLNRYHYLKAILQDLEKQTYPYFEVVVVDQSQPFQPDLYKAYDLNLQIIYQKTPALWLARNTAVKKAKGKIIMLSEDDVRIAPNWIENHLKCLDYFKADISAGVFYPEGSEVPKDRSFYKVASQFATGNAALYKRIFKQIGLFDRQFEGQRMGDGEFGLRAYLAGVKSVSTPFASCIDVKAPTGGLRQMGSWDAFRPKKWLAPRPIPSVLYLYRSYYGNKAARRALLKGVPPSVIPYQFKKNKAMLILGICISLVFLPLIAWQVFRSWKLATKKIKEGPLISELE